MSNEYFAEREAQIENQFESHLETVRSCLNMLVPVIDETGELVADRLFAGGKVLAFGNGGSADQADHLVGELIGRYRQTRAPLPAISLGASLGAVTCIANDFSFGSIYERQIEALVTEEDVVIGLTTSGSSENVLRGLRAGRDAGAATIMLTGGGITDAPSDHIISIPSTSTARIQEVHLMIIHVWCEAVDRRLSTDDK